MAWTFCNIRLKRFPTMATEWVLRIDSMEQLWEHEMAIGKGRATRVFHEEGQVAAGRKHYTDGTAIVVHTRAESRGTSWVRAYADLMTEVISNQSKVLMDGQILYLKSSGGYSYDYPKGISYDVLETKQSDELIYPHAEVRYIQWPNGNHWYAKFGDKDVEWQGKQKWDTREEAEKAVKFWKKSFGGWTQEDHDEERERSQARYLASKKS